MLADEQVGPALRTRRVVGAGELHQDVGRGAVQRAQQGELWKFTGRGGANNSILHRALRVLRVCVEHPLFIQTLGRLLNLVEPQPKSALTDDEAATLVRTEQRDRIQHVIIRPLAWVVAELQYRCMRPCELPP